MFTASNGVGVSLVDEFVSFHGPTTESRWVRLDGGHVQALREFFAAERAPWAAANPAELWLLRFKDSPDNDVSALADPDGWFIYCDTASGKSQSARFNNPDIVAGRKVWPA